MVSGLETFGHIFTAHAQERLFRNFRSKIWPRHSLRRPRFPTTGKFPLSDNVWGTYFMFLCIIFIWPCDLDLRPFDLGNVWWIKLRVSSARTNF